MLRSTCRSPWKTCGWKRTPRGSAVWLGIAPQEERMKAVEDVLGLPDTVRAFAIFPYGYPAEEHRQQDRFDRSRIHYVE